MTPAAPALRIRAIGAAPVRGGGEYVLYWMIAARRTRWSFALDRALAWAAELRRPLVVFEPLRVDAPWASARTHRFVLDGMADNARRCAAAGVVYVPYVEPARGAGKGLLEALAARAAVVVTDDFPGFFLPRMVAAAGRRLPVRLEAVDGNGLLPMAAAPRAFERAVDFRRFLQRQLPPYLAELPEPDPLGARARGLPRLGASALDAPLRRWPAASADLLAGNAAGRAELAALPLDAGVEPCAAGGAAAGEATLRAFVATRLAAYGEARNDPAREATSALSPFLHFGHLAAHQTFAEVVAAEGWNPSRVGFERSGAKNGWWGLSASAEGFLDQLVTWRELGYLFAARHAGGERYESLPAWARQTLERHAGDARPSVYALDELAAAATHDPLWNAAQRQLRREGRIHNYLRMLWGKKILEWSPDARQALAAMLELNNRYALDGRDPNSTSGITWCLGRFDRPWGPERPIFGTVRYMSSANTARKLDVEPYLRRYAA